MRKWVIGAIMVLGWGSAAHSIELESTVSRLEKAGGAELAMKQCEPYLPSLLKFQVCEFLQSRPAPTPKKGLSPGAELLARMDRPPAQYSIKIYLDDSKDVRWIQYREFDVRNRRPSIMREMATIVAGTDTVKQEQIAAYVDALVERKILPATLGWVEIDATTGPLTGSYEFTLKRK